MRISTHSYAPGRVGEQQVAIFEDEGVDLNRVYIGHSNDSTDLDYLLGLVKKGVWLGMDRYPSRRVLPRLQELGASDQDIHQITVENPRRFFEGT